MSDAPLMPKATAVWLVENTSLTFDQIAEFCKLHPLEVKGIADGEVATGIKGYDPISTGQLTREEIAAAEREPDHRLHLSTSKVRTPEFKKARGARYTPLSRRHDRPNAVLWLLRNHPELKDAQIMRLVGTTKHTLQAIRERTHWNSANLQPMDPVTLGLCSQIDLDFEVNRAAKERPKVEDDRSQTLVSAEITTARPTSAPASQLEVFGVPTPKPKPTEERVDVNSVFGKLKDKAPPAAGVTLTRQLSRRQDCWDASSSWRAGARSRGRCADRRPRLYARARCSSRPDRRVRTDCSPRIRPR